MLEIKQSRKHPVAWTSPQSCIMPTQNLTASDQKKLQERDDLLNKVEAEMKKDEVWIKINSGIYKGTIFNTSSRDDNDRWRVSATVDNKNDVRCASGGSSIHDFTKDLDPSKGWQWAKRSLTIWHFSGMKPISFNEGTIYPEFFGAEVHNSASLLIDYQGDKVFSLNEKKRPLTFEDRLEQEVGIGDLVVVALNYGAGLDICMVKGYADERRVVIESMEDGSNDRIPLENNATRKIMKMPMSLKDTALLMKLGRR